MENFREREVLEHGLIRIDMMDHKTVCYRQDRQCCFQNQLNIFQSLKDEFSISLLDLMKSTLAIMFRFIKKTILIKPFKMTL